MAEDTFVRIQKEFTLAAAYAARAGTMGPFDYSDQWLGDYQRYVERATWCKEQWGSISRDLWWYEDGEFKFADPRDEVLFRLRWA